MTSTAFTLLTVILFFLSTGTVWADSPSEASSLTELQNETQCRPAADEGKDWEQFDKVATVKVYCQFRIFCPAEHRCCNAGPTFWCCPLPAKCDANTDADDWTGCHGAQGVNPLP